MASQKTDNYAVPYTEKDDALTRIPFRRIDLVGPAGSINSNLEDMAQWLLVQVNRGKLGKERIMKGETLRDLHTPRITMGDLGDRNISPTAYASGWMVDTYRGHLRVHHGGAIDGFLADVAFYPHARVGVVVLTNREGTPAPNLLVREISDRVLELKAKNWSKKALGNLAKAKEAQKEGKDKEKTPRKDGTKPAHAPEEYVGQYRHPGYGLVEVSLVEKDLVISFNGLEATMKHWHYEVFKCTPKGVNKALDEALVRFDTDMAGNVATVRAKLEPAIDAIVFTKSSDPRLSDPQHLTRYVGKYNLRGQSIRVELKGTALTVTVPRQPTYDLVPNLSGTFTLKQQTSITVDFTEENDQVTALTFFQPNGVFTAKKAGNGGS